ncbi:MAG: DUF1330 domain-containing protein [Rhodomicrobiaceae bacterium]
MNAPTHQKRYLHPSDEIVKTFAAKTFQGAFVMLHLVLFRDIADYSADPELAPEEPISGREAYARYVEHTLPYLEASGGEILFIGEGGPFLIGPGHERWDRIALINHRTFEDFIAFATNEDYLKGIGHRSAALLDSRLLPIENLRQQN